MIIHLKTAFIKSKFVLSAILLIVMVYGFYPADVSAAGALQVNDNGKSIVVNTGAGLEYAINADTGDLTSAKLNGIKLTTSSGKGSHIKSGLGSSADVSWAMSSDGSSVIITTTEAEDDLTHYYISRSGENIIYMATYLGDGASFGEMRYIFRGNGAVLTNASPNSNNGGSTGNVESQDVKGHANGYTTSKYYGNDQAKDLGIRGVTGDGVGVFMAYGNREKSSGGPFFRDIQFQSGGDTDIYNYMFSGHNQTESLRKGLHGPYAYIFTTGETPSTPDFSWMSELNLLGWEAERGKVVLNGLAGMDSSYSYTVGFSNSNAQYWMTTNAKGSAVKSNMIPRTYTMTVYKGELAVHEQNVNVLAGSTTALNTITIKNDLSSTSALWRIGDWDGTPLEFLNGQNISKFHP